MLKRTLITISLCLLGGFILFSLYQAMITEIVNEVKVKEIEYKQADTVIFRIYDEIHQMANTKIIAEDGKVWGLISVTTRRVNTLIKEVEERAEFNEIEKAALLDILNRWKVKDFSQAVDDHNYVWDKLRGTVGRAIKLRK